MKTEFLDGWISIDIRHGLFIAPNCPFCIFRPLWLKFKKIIKDLVNRG